MSIALVFPPATEARQFPYLSLPMLTAFLRQQGVDSTQHDFNLELCHQLIQSENLERFLAGFDNSESLLKTQYRKAMLEYVLANRDLLFHSVFTKKKTSPYGIQHDVRFVRFAVDLAMEKSVLSKALLSVPDIIDFCNCFEIDENDIPGKILFDMVQSLVGQKKPKILGLSICYYSQWVSALLIAKWAKSINPEIKIIFGGQQVMLWKQKFVNTTALSEYVDAICIGAGEECIYRYFCLHNGECARTDVPEVIFLDEPEKPVVQTHLTLNDMPPPDFSDLDIYGYLAEEAHLAIITCVGCYWGRCVFCSYGNRSLNKYQQGSPEWIADTCIALLEKYGIDRINFVDENTHLKIVLQAMRIINHLGYKMRFSTRNRLEKPLLDPEFCRELAQRGCVLMSVGYETNSQRLLDKLDKGVESANYQEIINNLHQAGITLRFSVMGGVLDETERELEQSLDFLKRNEDKIGVDVMQMLVMEPNTLLSASPESYSLKADYNSQLRGNKLLNYGMGRVGYRYDYEDGDTFDSRLNKFISIFNKVLPQKNDEVAPNRRKSDHPDDAKYDVKKIVLQPWVRVIKACQVYDEAMDSFLIDLLWQRVFRIQHDLLHEDVREISVDSNDVDGQSLCAELIRIGMVSTVEERHI